MSNSIINVTILAHIDHGKSSLADWLMKICGQNIQHTQFLDKLQVEKKRGITIKAQAVRLLYKNCEINLIDTPGHDDFNYEANRAMRACENAILLVDATKGVEAQTIYKYKQASQLGLNIIPVINKIDLKEANINNTLDSIIEMGLDFENYFAISSKTGEGVDKLLDFLIQKEHKAIISNSINTKALIIDSWYDVYKGVFVLVKVIEGHFLSGQNAQTFHNHKEFKINSIGYFGPGHISIDKITSGQIGYINLALKNPKDIKVGDTIFTGPYNETTPIEGFQIPQVLLYSTLYNEDTNKIIQTMKALEQYELNDPAFTYEVITSTLYKTAFRCGFLGVLHLEIVLERLTDEFNISLNSTLPSVPYKITNQNHETKIITNPSDWINVVSSEESFAQVEVILLQEDYVGKVLDLFTKSLAQDIKIHNSKQLSCIIPLSFVIGGLNNQLLLACSGYVSMFYNIIGYKPSKLTKLEVAINENIVEDFAFIIHTQLAQNKARQFANTLSEIIPRGQMKIKIQILEGRKIIASETLQPYRKDVTSGCYGGDQSRKDKLLRNQKQGKKNLAQYNKNRTFKLPPGSYSKLLSF